MTIKQALADARIKRPSHFTDEDLIAWLNELELKLIQDVFLLYKGYDHLADFKGYQLLPPDSTSQEEEPLISSLEGEEQDLYSQQLLIKPPYDSLYRYWLYSMIDFHNGDISRYNGAATMFDIRLNEFKSHMIHTKQIKKNPTIKHIWI